MRMNAPSTLQRASSRPPPNRKSSYIEDQIDPKWGFRLYYFLMHVAVLACIFTDTNNKMHTYITTSRGYLAFYILYFVFLMLCYSLVSFSDPGFVRHDLLAPDGQVPSAVSPIELECYQRHLRDVKRGKGKKGKGGGGFLKDDDDDEEDDDDDDDDDENDDGKDGGEVVEGQKKVQGEKETAPSTAAATAATPPRQQQRQQQRRCEKCQIEQPLRSKHCRECNACVLKYDHHCPWIGVCVGKYNHRKFWLFLFVQFWLLAYCSHHLIGSFQSADTFDSWILTNGLRLVNTVIAVLFSFVVCGLLCYHSYLACTNVTSWEEAKRSKITYFDGVDDDVNPFFVGYATNCRLFWFPFHRHHRHPSSANKHSTV